MTTICAIGDPDQAFMVLEGLILEISITLLRIFRCKKDLLVEKLPLDRGYPKGIIDSYGKAKPLEGIFGKGEQIRIGACLTHSEEAEMVVEQVEKLMGGITLFSLDSERVSSHEDGEDLGFGDMAVLYRLNSQGDAFEEAFSRAGLPYVRSGEKALVNQYPVNIIWRFLQTLRYPDNDYYLKAYTELVGENDLDGDRISRGSTLEGTLEEIIDYTLTEHKFDLSSKESSDVVRRFKAIAENINGDIGSFLDNLSIDRGIDHTALSGDRIALMSLHAAKGWNGQLYLSLDVRKCLSHILFSGS